MKKETRPVGDRHSCASALANRDVQTPCVFWQSGGRECLILTRLRRK
jgi:hypothetical protein